MQLVAPGSRIALRASGMTTCMAGACVDSARMKRFLITLGVIAAAIAIYVAAFLTVNHQVASTAADIEREQAAELPVAGDTLELLNWNVGYGGLGRGSDFVADGGEHMFPPSREAVRANVAGIEAFLAQRSSSADIVVMQELARAGPVNYWINLRDRVEHRAFAQRIGVTD